MLKKVFCFTVAFALLCLSGCVIDDSGLSDVNSIIVSSQEESATMDSSNTANKNNSIAETNKEENSEEIPENENIITSSTATDLEEKPASSKDQNSLETSSEKPQSSSSNSTSTVTSSEKPQSSSSSSTNTVTSSEKPQSSSSNSTSTATSSEKEESKKSEIEVLLNNAHLTPLKTTASSIDDMIGEIFSKIHTPNMSTYEKVKACYDYLVDNCEYGSNYNPNDEVIYVSDYDQTMVSYAYGILKDSIGVCDHYNNAFAVMCRRIGLEAYTTNGTVSKKTGGRTGHTWAYIVLNGKQYIFDPQVQDKNQQAPMYFFGKTYQQMGTMYEETENYDPESLFNKFEVLFVNENSFVKCKTEYFVLGIGFKIKPRNGDLKIGDQIRFEESVAYDPRKVSEDIFNYEIEYSSKNNDVATVRDGIIKIVGKGETIIYGKMILSGKILAIAEYKITVKN